MGLAAERSPARKVTRVVQKKATRRPRASATRPHVGAPKSMPTKTTEVRRPSWAGLTPHSQRTDGPRKDRSIISMASPIHANPVKKSITSWNRPNPAPSIASSTVHRDPSSPA